MSSVQRLTNTAVELMNAVHMCGLYGTCGKRVIKVLLFELIFKKCHLKVVFCHWYLHWAIFIMETLFSTRKQNDYEII